MQFGFAVPEPPKGTERQVPTGAMSLTSTDVEVAQNQAGNVERNNFHLKMTI